MTDKVILDKIEAVVRQTISDCEKIAVAKGWVAPSFSINVHFSKSLHRIRSRGGKYRNGAGVSIAGLSLIEMTAWTEYAHIIADPEIGAFKPRDQKVVWMALAAHEAAHAVQRHIGGTHEQLGSMDKPHGEGWQNIYREFRRELVNPLIDRPSEDELNRFTVAGFHRVAARKSVNMQIAGGHIVYQGTRTLKIADSRVGPGFSLCGRQIDAISPKAVQPDAALRSVVGCESCFAAIMGTK